MTKPPKDININGYLIETGEIETRLTNIKGISGGVVLALDDNNGIKYLCAYYVANREIDEIIIEQELEKNLPEYMLPRIYVYLDKFPLTPSGQVDRKSLPKPYVSSLQSEYIAPRNEVERIVTKAVVTILKIEQISVLDNFFKLGGSSITAIALVSELAKRGLTITIADILENPIIEVFIKTIRKTKYEIISLAPLEDTYPVTSSQKGMYITDMLGNQGTAYNIPLQLSFTGDLDKEHLGLVIDDIIKRHESLRTHFEYINDEVVQIVHQKITVSKEYKKISHQELATNVNSFIKPFNLSRPALFRVCLLELSRTEYIMLVDFHHIVFDSKSIDIFIDDLCRLYRGEDLEPLSICYKDYAYWYNHSYSNSKKYIETRDYWIKNIKNASEIEFTYNYTKSFNKNNKAGYVSLEISANLQKSISKYCNKLNITPYMLTMGVYIILLSRYSRQKDIIVGTSTSGRTHTAISDNIGMFVNTLPFRINIDDKITLSEYFTQIKDNSINLLKYQDYSFEQLVQDANLKYVDGQIPLISFFFNYLEQKLENDLGDVSVKTTLSKVEDAMFNLTLTIEKLDDYLFATVQYKQSLFDKVTVDRLLGHYIHLLESIVNLNTTKQLKELELANAKEKKLILDEFNDNKTNPPKNETFLNKFDEIVDIYGNNIAVINESESISYKEIDLKSNQLAHYLINTYSLVTNDTICLLFDPSIEMIISILAVFKAGAAYVPIAPEFPFERRNYIYKDSRAKVLITQELFILNMTDKETLCFNIDEFDYNKYSDKHPNIYSTNTDLAYIIYTSGTTGKPKGVMLEHKALLNYCQWNQDFYQLTYKDKLTKYAGFGFDASVWEIFPVLYVGGSLHMISKDIKLQPQLIADYINDNKISISFLPTQFAEILMQLDLSSLRYLWTGGDKLKTITKNNNLLVSNNYGPTEACVSTTAFIVDDFYNNIPIGKPIANYKVYILDDNLNICPIGVPGELCVAGEGLARGYVNLDELTDKVFINHPTLKQRIYRTGDLATWKDDGNIEYLGRIDLQVKIRGYRIELGEIETRLVLIDGVSDAVVLALDDKNNNKYLCGYYVADNKLDRLPIQHKLKEYLPYYMVPDVYVQMDKFPLTPNGKVNRKILPEPDLSSLQAEYVAPRNEMEEKIATIWAEVLDINQIGIDDSFFAIGGNSIKAISVISILQSSGLQLSIADIFDYKTIRNITENVSINSFDINIKFNQIIQIATQQGSKQYIKNLANLQQEAHKRVKSLENELEKFDVTKICDINTVLVTGATGFLGSHIVNELISNNKNVIAIVRGKNDIEAFNRTKLKLNYYFGKKLDSSLERGTIKVFAGDLIESSLGLIKIDYDYVVGNVDSIIHTAANVSHYGEYDRFYQDNVVPVKNLINLVKQNKNISFNYISTRSVCEKGYYKEQVVVFNEKDLPLAQNINNVYILTKLEGEIEAIKAREDGIKTNIYRVGNLVYNSQTQKHQENLKDNGFFQTLTSVLNIGKVYNSFSVEMSCIDDTARAICSIFDKFDLQNGIYHTYNSKLTDLNEILTENKLGLSLDIVSFEEFVNNIRKKYSKSAFVDYIKNYMLHNNWLDDDYSTVFVVQQDYTNRVMKKLNFAWTDISSDNINDMIVEGYKQRVQDFDKFNIFESIDKKTIVKLAKKAKLRSFDADDNIIKEGLKADKLYLLQSGFVALNLTASGGWQSNIGIASTGDYIGTDSICNDEYFLTAEVILDDCCVYEIQTKDIELDKTEFCKLLQNLLKIEISASQTITNLLTLMG